MAITGQYTAVDGAPFDLLGACNYGMPTNVVGMIQSIQDGRPFIFAWKGHVFVAYGLRYYFPTPQTIQITEVKLIDPLFPYGNPMYTRFVVGRDNFNDINGTFELVVLRGRPMPVDGAVLRTSPVKPTP